ncbi:albumin isoform X3 [Pipistrellus kuhlii]|uniref:albumin isoform X3 n=1 Tax=Pipistrellus kuhlii TaxID=59472 RepID=UPI001E26F154|nr:albumin isoform X3 [Pipistrellus kuhlii]
MKGITFICVLFLFSSAYSRGVFRRDAHKSEVAHRFKDLGEENFRGLVLVTFAQYLQKCPFEEHVKLANEVTAFAKTCVADESAENCGKSLHTLFGDKLCTVASLRGTYGDMADCCEKQEPERNECFLKHKDDNLNLSALERPDPEAMCTAYEQNEQMFLGKYLYEVARRHPFFYGPELLYFAKEYKEVLKGCCSKADKAACLGPELDALKEKVVVSGARQRLKCSSLQKFGDRAFKAWSVARLSQKFPGADFMDLSKVFDELKPLVDEPKELVTKNCELFENLGEYGFQNALLVRYTKKLPQVSTPTLVDVSRKLGRVGSHCCKLPEVKRMGCAEDYLSVVLNWLCVSHEKAPVSDKVTKCCTESLVGRRPCFSALEADETFTPKEFNAETFTFHANVCALPEPEQQVKKQTALVELLKHKPKATDEQLKTVMGEFTTFFQKCCTAADKEACFAEEGPKLVASSQAALA